MFSFADDFELQTYFESHASMNSAHYTTLSDHSNKLTVVHTSHVRQKKTIVKEFNLEPEVRRMKYWIASRNVTQYCDLWASVCCVDVDTSLSFYKTHARNESENSPLVGSAQLYRKPTINRAQSTKRAKHRVQCTRETARKCREPTKQKAQRTRETGTRGACMYDYRREKKGRVIFFLTGRWRCIARARTRDAFGF